MKKFFKSPFFWAVLAALLVIAPQLRIYQFLGTDCIHVGVLEGRLDYPGLGPFALYQFSDGTPQWNAELVSKGLWPWFINPYWKINFCRHLPSALTALNHQLCGLHPTGYVIHSLLWYIALVVLLGLLASRLAAGWAGRSVALLTMVIFAVSMSHAEVIFYCATRWMLMAAVFALLALLAHMSWREQGWKPGRFLSIAAIVLALLCGEAALAALAFLAAYELFGRSDPFKRRITALLPAVGLVVVYLIIYRIVGYGTGGQGLYLNPFNDPGAFIVGLPMKMVSILGDMFFGALSLFGINPMNPAQRLLALGGGAAALIIIALLFLPVWLKAEPGQRRGFNWIMVGTVAAMLPLASAYPCGRAAMIPFIGGSMLLAFILVYWAKRLRKNLKSPLAWLAGLFCLGLFLLNVVYTPYRWFADAAIAKKYLDMEAASHKETVLNDIQPHQEAIFLNNDPYVDWVYSGYLYRKVNGLPMPAKWWQLSYSNQKHRWLRTAEDTLELEIPMTNPFETYDVYGMYVPGTVLEKGHVTRLSGLEVTVLDIDEKGMVRIAFKFAHSLDDDRYRFYKFREDKLHQVEPPGIGQSISLE